MAVTVLGLRNFRLHFRFCIDNILPVNSYTPICAVRHLRRAVESRQTFFIFEPDMLQTSSAPFSHTFVGRFASLSTGDSFRGTYFFFTVGLNPLPFLRRTLPIGTILYRIVIYLTNIFCHLPLLYLRSVGPSFEWASVG